LANYDVLFIYASQADDLSAVGNEVATYVDGGGRLVTATYFYQAQFEGGAFGALGDPKYIPFKEYDGSIQQTATFTATMLGEYNPNHPIMNGPAGKVTVLSSDDRDVVSLNSNTVLVASWNDKTPLAAVTPTGNVGLTFHPNPLYLRGDYIQLIANALLFAATPPLPSITSELTIASNINSPFLYTISATNNPTDFDAFTVPSGTLPSGLTVNNATGIISGVPLTSGVFSVIISASNASGDGIATLIITILSLEQQINNLTKFVTEMNGAQGISNFDLFTNSLESKLDAAAAALADVKKGDNPSAKGKIQAFINEVIAQKGKKLTNEQADQLIAAAHEILMSLG